MPDLSIAIGCMVWVPVAAWVVTMIHYMIGDEIDVITGILCILVGLILGAYTMMSKDPVTRPYFVLAALSMLIIFPWFRGMMEKRELRNIEIEAIERAYENLGKYPTHLGAKIRIARGLYQRGFTREAITLAEKALENTPKRLAEDEHRQLREWKMDVPPFEPLRWMNCPHCSCNNAPSEFFCAHCGRPLWEAVAKQTAFSSESLNLLLLLWLAGIVGLVGIPLASAYVSPQLKVVAVVGILIAVAAIALFALRRYRTTA